MQTQDYEIMRKTNYHKFNNAGREFLLSDYPYLDIVMNDHCNARCKFCVADLIHNKLKANIQTYKEKIRYAIAEMGVKEILLLGGEATINDDMFEIIDYLIELDHRGLYLNKICLTTNGLRMVRDSNYMAKLASSGITHINLSLMSLDPQKQKEINNSKTTISIDDLKLLHAFCKNRIHLRINNNVFKGNNDSVNDMLDFYNQVRDCSDSVKFSPLLKTDSFSTVNKITEFNRKHILSDKKYDELWHGIEKEFNNDYPIIRNKQTFGFVEYSMLMMPTPIILNYNQHGQMKAKCVEENKINSLKLLPTGDLSVSWNREEKNWFINCEEK